MVELKNDLTEQSWK